MGFFSYFTEFFSDRSPQWSKVREAHLLKEPFCQACGSTKDLNVHHIEPYHECPEKELDPENLIILCETSSMNCHLFFGHFKNWKKSNPNVREMVNDVFKYFRKTLSEN